MVLAVESAKIQPASFGVQGPALHQGDPHSASSPEHKLQFGREGGEGPGPQKALGPFFILNTPKAKLCSPSSGWKSPGSSPTELDLLRVRKDAESAPG